MSTTAQTHAARAMAYAFARNVASMQAAYIEWTRGDGADHGMAWISNTLCGPGLLPDAGSATAQEFFDCEMEKLDKLYPDVTMNPPIPSPAWCASVDAELAATAEADAQPVEEKSSPMFWVRLLHDGLYKGPVHNNSVLGKMQRDEKPDQWVPLYRQEMPPPTGWTLVPIGDLKELYDSLHGNYYMGEEWEKKAISSMMPKEPK